jgi:hypothetical protein
MALDTNFTKQLARARELRETGESARRRDGATAQKCYEQSRCSANWTNRCFLAHTVRHLGDVYHEEAGGKPLS